MFIPYLKSLNNFFKQVLPSADKKISNMLHTYSRIYIHLVWSVKGFRRIIDKKTGITLFNFLIDKSSEMNIKFLKLNIQPEHIHGLIDLPTNKTLAEFMQMMKGSSSRMLNQNCFSSKFEWQRGYGAFSVSRSKLDRVCRYIQNQTEHHKKNSFEEEYQAWKREYGFIDD